MPSYKDYCTEWRREFDLMRPMNRIGEPPFCPECGTEGERLVSACASKVDFDVRPPGKACLQATWGLDSPRGNKTAR